MRFLYPAALWWCGSAVAVAMLLRALRQRPLGAAATSVLALPSTRRDPRRATFRAALGVAVEDLGPVRSEAVSAAWRSKVTGVPELAIELTVCSNCSTFDAPVR